MRDWIWLLALKSNGEKSAGKLALVPQSSMNSFNPVYTIGKTLDEMYRVHMPNLSKQEKREQNYS
ncbi:MAG: hypothetical protein ACLSCV_11075 [Acutalibacteraceae bacterium]